MAANEEGPFTQVLLSEEDLGRGMWFVEDVYIPDDAIAMVDIRAPELGKMAGVSFQESFDNLDWCPFAVLKFAAGFSVSLKDHRHSPVEGVKIYTDSEGRKSKERLMDILHGIHVSPDHLIWVWDEFE